MRRNRSETDLIASVLSCCEEPHRVRALIRDANTSYNRLQPLLDHLVQQGLVSIEEHSDAVYTTTGAGMKFLCEYMSFRRLCDAYALTADNL